MLCYVTNYPIGYRGGGTPSSLTATIQASTSSINVGEAVQFSVTASGTDTQDVTVGWDFNYDGQTVNATASGPSVTHNFIGPGVYTIAADVTDAAGDEQIVTTTVSVKDSPTLVPLSAGDLEVNEGDTVPFATPQIYDVAGSFDLGVTRFPLVARPLPRKDFGRTEGGSKGPRTVDHPC